MLPNIFLHQSINPVHPSVHQWSIHPSTYILCRCCWKVSTITGTEHISIQRFTGLIYWRFTPASWTNKNRDQKLEIVNNSNSNFRFNTMEQSVPIQTGFDKFFLSFKINRIRDSQQKERKDINNDKKKNLIRFGQYQLYPIYKIKNSKKKIVLQWFYWKLYFL